MFKRDRDHRENIVLFYFYLRFFNTIHASYARRRKDIKSFCLPKIWIFSTLKILKKILYISPHCGHVFTWICSYTEVQVKKDNARSMGAITLSKNMFSFWAIHTKTVARNEIKIKFTLKFWFMENLCLIRILLFIQYGRKISVFLNVFIYYFYSNKYNTAFVSLHTVKKCTL